MKFFNQYKFLSFLLVSALLFSVTIPVVARPKNNLLNRIKASFGKFFRREWKQMDSKDVRNVVGTTVATAVIFYGIYKIFIEKDKPEPAQILPNQQQTPAPRPGRPPVYYRRLNNNRISIRSIPVPRQRGGSCAYHSLLNAIKLLNALHNNTNLNQILHILRDNSLINERFGRNGWWRQLIINNRRPPHAPGGSSSIERGEFLDQDEIRSLIQIERDGQLLNNIPCEFIITPGYNSNYVRWNNILQQLDISGSFSYVFIVNSGGHWYVIVLHKSPDGHHYYYVMESSGQRDLSRNDHNIGLRQIITQLEGQQVARLL